MGSKKVEEKDYYELLGVGRDATTEEIKHAYREIARVYHPDSNFFSEIIDTPPTERDQQIFKLVTAAYDVLLDPEKREAYDKTLLRGLRDWGESEANNVAPPSGWNESPQSVKNSRPIPQRGFGQVKREEYVSKSTIQHTRPLNDLLQTTKRTIGDRVLLFIGLGVPLITLAGAAIYIYWFGRK